ncbi:nucleotidyltransferase [Actinomycetes bacterium NPDC127524]
MRAVGVVVEHNPFHNGHAFHIAQSRKKSGADIVAAVMSGPFLQRGEPSLVSKWARAEMALSGGADLVIELPFAFAPHSAEIFARGSISILEALKCEAFCFGSEEGKIEPFLQTYHFLKENQVLFDELLKKFIKEGNSYPKAASLVFSTLSKGGQYLDLTKPNNILGYEYVKAALSNGFSIKPVTIQRIGADYHETELISGHIASATGIRKALSENGQDLSRIGDYIPLSTKEILGTYMKTYHSFHTWEHYWPLLKYKIVSSTPSQLAEIYEVEEGIEHRMQEAALSSSNFQEFMGRMKTKRYTWTRIQRILIHVLAGTPRQNRLQDGQMPQYLRLLGMTARGRNYLSEVKKSLPLPLISKLSSYHDKNILPDINAANIYAMGLKPSSQNVLIKREYEAPVMLP